MTLARLASIGDVHVSVDFYAGHPIWIGIGVDGADSSRFAYPNCLLLDDSFGGTVGGLVATPSPGGNWEDEQKCNAIGLTVIGGPIFSTMRTLQLVPAYFSIAISVEFRNDRLFHLLIGAEAYESPKPAAAEQPSDLALNRKN